MWENLYAGQRSCDWNNLKATVGCCLFMLWIGCTYTSTSEIRAILRCELINKLTLNHVPGLSRRNTFLLMYGRILRSFMRNIFANDCCFLFQSSTVKQKNSSRIRTSYEPPTSRPVSLMRKRIVTTFQHQRPSVDQSFESEKSSLKIAVANFSLTAVREMSDD